MWRAQAARFASEGWRCIAPDMRDYGGSSAPATPDGYALKEIVDDMVELHDHLVDRIQHLVPSPDGCDDLVRVLRPAEGARVVIGLSDISYLTSSIWLRVSYRFWARR